MRNGVFLMAAILVACGVRAANLVAEGEISVPTVPAEYRLADGGTGAMLENFEEELTWNRCLKVTVTKNARTKGGKDRTVVEFLAGGTKDAPGYPVVGGKKYRFSFEARGTVAHAVAKLRYVRANGAADEVKSDLGEFNVTKDWTRFGGSFVAPEDARTVSIAIWLFADFEKWPGGVYPFPEGSCLLLDKFSLDPVTVGREIWPARALVLPDDPADEAVAGDFSLCGVTRLAAELPSRLHVRRTAEGLRFELEMSGATPVSGKDGVWGGDSAELMIRGADAKADPLHYAVGPDGRTWAAETNPKESACACAAAVTGETDWTARFEISWRALGFASEPAKGTVLRFNVARNAPSVADRAKRVSSFGYVGLNFSEYDRYPVLFVGAPGGLEPGADAGAFYLAREEAKEKERLAKLQREKCVVAQLPVDFDPSVPFLPDELMDPSAKLVCTAAVNERAALPVAIANMTDAPEEFRVQVVRGYEKVDWQGYGHLTSGLKTSDGRVIGKDRITLMRGVRFRDADAKDRGTRYDVLAKLDAVSAVPVPPKEAGLLWIEIRTDGLEPGLYRGRLLVTRMVGGEGKTGKLRDVIRYKTVDGVEKCPVIGDDTKEIPIEFEVLPLELEPADFGFCGYAAPHTEMEIAAMDELGSVGSLVSPWGFKFACDADGRIVERRLSETVRRDIERIRDKAAKRGANPRIMVGYSWYTVFRKAHAKENKLEPQSAAYWRAYREYTRFLADTMCELGVATDDYMVEVIDEPAHNKMTREEVVNAYRIAKETAPDLQLVVTEGEKAFFEDLFPYVDLWIFRFVHYGDPQIQEYARRMRGAGKRLSMYACYTSPRQDPHRYYRQLSWKAAAWGAPFVSLYQLFDNPHEVSFRRTTYGGIAYWTEDGLIPSIRQKSMEAGITDVRYMRALERLAARTADAALIREVRSLVERSIEEVTRTKQHDPTTTTRFREACARLIRKLICS